MASIKVVFRPSTVADREGTIYYRIIHERKTRQILSRHHVFPSEWDDRRSTVRTDRHNDRRPLLLAVRDGIRRDVERIVKIDCRLEENILTYTTDDLVDEYRRFLREGLLFGFMERIIGKLKSNGKVRTAETYTSALASFRSFRGGEDLMLDTLDSETMEKYETWLKDRGLVPNSISFYTRILRAVYNRAVDEGLTDNRAPFRHVYTGVDKTVKRALPITAIRRIKALDLASSPTLDFARDMFMMSFYLRGMSFIDMAFLRKTNLSAGHVVYRRRKTGQLLSIKWTKEMQAILDKYPRNSTAYLLPIITRACADERIAYHNHAYLINTNLKKIAAALKLDFRLTMYVARHSWASAAKSKGIPLSVISEGMGHDSEATTQIYLASLETSVVDRANSIIISSVK